MMTSFDDPFGPKEHVVFKEDFSFHIGNLLLYGQDIFVYLLFIGIATTSLIALWNHKLSKGIVYPISIGLIAGILLGIIFPATGVYLFEFNRQVLFTVLAISFSISLISIGRYFLKK